MALFSRLICALLLLAAASTLAAQTASGERLWHLETHGFRERFHRDLGFDAGWGGGLSVRRALPNTPLSIAAGLEFSRIRHNLHFVDEVIHAQVHTFSFTTALRAMHQPFKPIGVFAKIFLEMSRFAPQPLEVDGGVLGKQRFTADAERKLLPGIGAGVELELSHALAINLHISTKWLKSRAPELFAEENASVMRSVWRFQAGLSFVF